MSRHTLAHETNAINETNGPQNEGNEDNEDNEGNEDNEVNEGNNFVTLQFGPYNNVFAGHINL